MAANPSEITNFFWHCLVAAWMTDEFEKGTVTNSYRLRAVRMATDCWAGRNGVQYASDEARAQRDSRGNLPWKECGLIKEHAIPVAFVKKIVYDEMRPTIAGAAAVEPLILSDDERQGLTPEVVDLFQQNPRAWMVARIIRNLTLHAWITKVEHTKLTTEGFGDRMPMGWTPDKDPFVRYRHPAVDINVSKI